MELVNDAYRLKDGLYGDPTGDAARPLRDRDRGLADLPLRAAPRRRGLRAADRRAGLGAALAARPTRRCSRSDTVTLVVQVNGKLRDRIEVAGRRAARRSCCELARASEKVAAPPRRQGDRQGDRRPGQAGQPRRSLSVHGSAAAIW